VAMGVDAACAGAGAVISEIYTRFAGTRLGLISAAWLRVSLSLIALVEYLWHIPLRATIWGPNGQFLFSQYINLTNSNPFQLYRYSSSGLYFDVIYFASVAIALLFMLGIFPRITCWLFAITAYSIFHRNELAADAGQDLLVLVSWLLCFCDSGRYLALLPGRALFSAIPSLTQIVTMLHNAGRFLIAWQVCMVYFWAAFYKVSGEEWRHGTALYYALSVERFQWFPWLSHAIASNGIIVAIASYSTVIAQMAFPFLMWNQRTKPYIIAIVVGLHGSIAILMGLISFSATIVSVDISLLSDGQFLAAIRAVRAVLRKSTAPMVEYVK
jgi:hypothetical protein